MNNILVLYIGDDPVVAGYLKTYSETLGWQTTIISASTATSEASVAEPDVCLFDLNDDTFDNESVVHLLKQAGINKLLLTDGGNESLYLESRKFLPFAYLVRPVTAFQLRAQIESLILFQGIRPKTVEILQSWREEEEVRNSFYVKSSHKLLKVKQSDILAVIADGNYCFLITSKRKHAIKISLRKIKLKLSALLFQQIHRNYIVQLPRVDSVDLSTNEVSVNGELYPIGGSFRQQLLSQLDRI